MTVVVTEGPSFGRDRSCLQQREAGSSLPDLMPVPVPSQTGQGIGDRWLGGEKGRQRGRLLHTNRLILGTLVPVDQGYCLGGLRAAGLGVFHAVVRQPLLTLIVHEAYCSQDLQKGHFFIPSKFCHQKGRVRLFLGHVATPEPEGGSQCSTWRS